MMSCFPPCRCYELRCRQHTATSRDVVKTFTVFAAESVRPTDSLFMCPRHCPMDKATDMSLRRTLYDGQRTYQRTFHPCKHRITFYFEYTDCLDCSSLSHKPAQSDDSDDILVVDLLIVSLHRKHFIWGSLVSFNCS